MLQRSFLISKSKAKLTTCTFLSELERRLRAARTTLASWSQHDPWTAVSFHPAKAPVRSLRQNVCENRLATVQNKHQREVGVNHAVRDVFTFVVSSLNDELLCFCGHFHLDVCEKYWRLKEVEPGGPSDSADVTVKIQTSFAQKSSRGIECDVHVFLKHQQSSEVWRRSIKRTLTL